jgi:membrane-bound serine protease (ClpP class)
MVPNMFGQEGPWTMPRRVTLIGLLLLLLLTEASGAQPAKPLVYLVPIGGVIDLGLAPFVERALNEAADAGAAAVILEVNTFGGRVDAAVLIRDALLRSRVRTVAFVNQRAISAGALISLAAETVAMAEGGTIGAATPVQIGLPGAPAQPVEEKTVSYMRKEFRATAESRHRPPLFAEAMVDADVVIPGVIEKGKLLTLTTAEALKHGIAQLQSDSVEALLKALDLSGAEVHTAAETWAETVVRFLTHPVVSSLLMTVGILGIIIEIQSPGFGLPGLVGLSCLALFLGGHWIVQLAGWEQVLLIGIGLLLLAVEVFVLPGFGIAGVFGILALLAGLGSSLVGEGATWDALLAAVGRAALSLLVAIVAGFAVLRLLPRTPMGRRLILQTGLSSGSGYTSEPEGDHRWLGHRGTTVSPLRPSGIAQLDGERVDVVSEGGFLEAGMPVEVIRVDGNRIVVRSVAGAIERSAS